MYLYKIFGALAREHPPGLFFQYGARALRYFSYLLFLPVVLQCSDRPRYHIPERGPVSVEIPPLREAHAPDPESIRAHGVDPEQIGYIVYDLEKKKVLEAHRAKEPRIPASTSKLLTVVGALDTLGPRYRYQTALAHTGSIRGSKLAGHLYLKGSGDPNFRVGDLHAMVHELKKSGVRHVMGSFYYDDSALPHVTHISDVMDEDESYNAGISALSFEFNAIHIRWYPSGRGNGSNGKPEFFLYPDLSMNEIRFLDRSWEDEQRLWVKEKEGREVWMMPEQVDRVGGKRLPVRNPSLYAAQVFQKLAGLEGIEVPDPQPGVLPGERKIISMHKSSSLLGHAESLLTYSNNIMAELLLLKTARRLGHNPKNLQDAAAVLENYYKKRFPRIDWKNFHLHNGSGLTSKTRITPEQLLAVLIYAEDREYRGRPFQSLLSPSGMKWSLRHRLNRPNSALRVWAKTGTINYSVALAGYAHATSGRKLAFAIFVNDIDKRTAYEKDPDRRTKTEQRRAGGWIWHNRNAMDSVIESWLEKY